MTVTSLPILIITISHWHFLTNWSQP